MYMRSLRNVYEESVQKVDVGKTHYSLHGYPLTHVFANESQSVTSFVYVGGVMRAVWTILALLVCCGVYVRCV